MTTTSRVRDQRAADHLDLIATPHQQPVGQQHVRARTADTTRSAWLHPPLDPAHQPNIAAPPPTPRSQPITTPRTPQPARRQLALDPPGVATYDEHRCLRHHSGRAPSSNCQEERGGPCAYTHPHADASKPPPPTPDPHPAIPTPDDANHATVLTYRGVLQLGAVDPAAGLGDDLVGPFDQHRQVVKHPPHPSRVWSATAGTPLV